MNILIFNWQDIKNPLGGGAEVHLHEIFKRIASKGHKVVLVSCEIPGEPKNEVIDGIQIHREGKRNTFNFSVPKVYKQKYMKENYDIVIDDINKIPFYLPLFVSKPLIAISHHFFGTSIFRETNFLAGMYVVLAEKFVNIIYKGTPIITVSESTKEEFIKRKFNPKNLSIVHNAIAQEDFPMRVGDKNEQFTITYFGRLKKYKSVHHLLYAFSNIQKEFPGAMLEIIGRGDYKDKLESIARKRGFSEKVIFHGFVSEEEKIKLLSKSHVVVNTSIKEGWGITNIETNACGTPVISANSPGLRDSVKDNESGLLYKYGDIDDLTKKINLLINDKEKLQQLSEGAIKWAENFSWDKSAEKMLNILKEVAYRDPNYS